MRQIWREMVRDNIDVIPASWYVFIDETHIKPEDCLRHYGYSVSGLPAITNRWKHTGDGDNCTSALVSLTLGGVMSVTVFTEEMTGVDFIHALQSDILPQMNPFPGERSILVMDNASTHFKLDCIALCSNIGCLCNFLPAYSPDLNPVELVHAYAKQYIRNKYNYAENPISHHLVEAFYSLDAIKSCNYFDHCGIPVSQTERNRFCI